MESGTTFVGPKIFFEIDDPVSGGLSYFATKEEAIWASAQAGRAQHPREVRLWEFSDGSLCITPSFVNISEGPNEVAVARQRAKELEALSPAQQLIFAKEQE